MIGLTSDVLEYFFQFNEYTTLISLTTTCRAINGFRNSKIYKKMMIITDYHFLLEHVSIREMNVYIIKI